MRFTRLVVNFGLPLLAKELTEQAARKRTFRIRVAYAGFMFLTAFVFFYETLRQSAASPLAVLGKGREMYAVLVATQFAGIYLFMPAMTCGLVTQEKERASLQLLFLTRLGPWTILFEKLLGRLVPMCCFLLLSLPLLGFAYTLGGVSSSMIWTGLWILVLAAIQMGTLALACSAYFRTTVGAFIASYSIGFLMLMGPYFVWMLLYLVLLLFGADLESVVQGFGSSASVMSLMVFPFCGAWLFMTFMPSSVATESLVTHSLILLSLSGMFLVVARRCLVSRAFLPPRNFLVDFFQAIDRTAFRRNEKGLAPGIVVVPDPPLLPEDNPIAWRETTKRALGRSRNLVRILLIVEISLVTFCALLTLDDGVPSRIAITLMVLMLWALAVLVVAVQSASLIAGERSHQTLDVLCATPISGREIVLQKFRGILRLMFVLAVPFVTIFLYDAWWKTQIAGQFTSPGERFSGPLYLACSALAVMVYLPLVAWLSLWIGLMVRTQSRAIIWSIAVIVAWCVVPFIFIAMPLSISLQGKAGTDHLQMCSMLTSPAGIIFLNEFDADDFLKQPGMPMMVNFAVYGAAAVVIRGRCLRNADRWLGRAEASPEL